jgi:hypothetical protein
LLYCLLLLQDSSLLQTQRIGVRRSGGGERSTLSLKIRERGKTGKDESSKATVTSPIKFFGKH